MRSRVPVELTLDAFFPEHLAAARWTAAARTGVWLTCDGCGEALSRRGDKSNQPDTEYRGFTIEVQSYGSEGDRWRPKAVVAVFEGGVVHLKTVNAPLSELFDTETEADTYTLGMAKK